MWRHVSFCRRQLHSFNWVVGTKLISNSKPISKVSWSWARTAGSRLWFVSPNINYCRTRSQSPSHQPMNVTILSTIEVDSDVPVHSLLSTARTTSTGSHPGSLRPWSISSEMPTERSYWDQSSHMWWSLCATALSVGCIRNSITSPGLAQHKKMWSDTRMYSKRDGLHARYWNSSSVITVQEIRYELHGTDETSPKSSRFTTSPRSFCLSLVARLHAINIRIIPLMLMDFD